ncbi:MAG TPA: hypothetical protein VHV30_16880 [Polyangiaceae bacterium]|jgi:hypothetical protein|nr:hypothetical protein [Polyangiaceae bacterium]
MMTKRARGLLVLLWLCAGAPAGTALAADDGPTIAKDSVQVSPVTLDVYHQDFNTWSWVPRVSFRVNGPVPSGGQLYGEFAIPGAPPVKFDCATSAIAKGHSLPIECGGRDVPQEKGTLFTGMVPFSIKMRNELSGAADVTLFAGRAKIEKVHANEHGPKAAQEFVYYANHDWNLPIGYAFITSDEVRQWDLPTFHVAFWVRGEDTGFEPHLFYKGNEVGKIVMSGIEAGKPWCDAEIENNTSELVDESVPQKAKWARVGCTFPNVRPWDKTSTPGSTGLYLLSKNPGDYELKVLWNGHLARSLKFTVTADGKFDNGLAAANKLNSDRAIVPVQVLGDQDGTWDKTAWRSAFYGNPLTGFTAP